jgi:hypothetical protein
LEVTRVGDVVEVADVKWKRVENITRDVREGVERFDLQVKSFVINGSTTEKELFWLCRLHVSNWSMWCAFEQVLPCTTLLSIPY